MILLEGKRGNRKTNSLQIGDITQVPDPASRPNNLDSQIDKLILVQKHLLAEPAQNCPATDS